MKKPSLTSNTFFGGAAILAASIAVVKVIGALYKIPLGRILGDVGFGHFNNAYAIYNLLLMISQAGLPVAMSKTISEANALGRRNQVSRVFRVALTAFLVLGIASSLIMFLFAQPLANLQGDSLAAPAVRVMALSCFFVCVMSAYRGYAQGHSDHGAHGGVPGAGGPHQAHRGPVFGLVPAVPGLRQRDFRRRGHRRRHRQRPGGPCST